MQRLYQMLQTTKKMLVCFSNFEGRPASPTQGMYEETLRENRPNIPFLVKMRLFRLFHLISKTNP